MKMLLSVSGLPQELELPPNVQNAILELQKEYDEGDITQKGYEKKLNRLLEQYLPQPQENPTQYSEADSFMPPTQNSSFPTSPDNNFNSLQNKMSELSLQPEAANPLYSPPSSNGLRLTSSQVTSPVEPYSHARSRSNSGSFSGREFPPPSSNFSGFAQITSKHEVQTRSVYPKPILSNLHPSTLPRHKAHPTLDMSVRSNYSTTLPKFRTISSTSSNPGLRNPQPEPLSRPHTSYQREPYGPPTNHHRNHSSTSDSSRYLPFNQQRSNFKPPNSAPGTQIDEIPHYLRDRSNANSRGEQMEKGPNFSSPPRTAGSYDAPPFFKDFSSNSKYQDRYLVSPSPSQFEQYDVDQASLHSRQSYDRSHMARRPSISSSLHSRVSRDSPSFYNYADQKPMPTYPNIIGVLNHRTIHTPKAAAITVVDSKGKDAVRLSWEKFHAMVDKYYQLLLSRRVGTLPAGTRVSLFFRKVEVADFLAACFGCFIAGLVAVPIVATESLNDFRFILENSQSWAVITTEANLKSVAKSEPDSWMGQYEWIRSNDRIPQQFKRKKPATFKDPAEMSDLAILEYSRDVTGELRGVGISHRTLIAQCQAFRELLDARENNEADTSPSTPYAMLPNPNLPVQTASSAIQALLVGIEPRAHLGLLLGGFIAPFCGFHTVFLSSANYELPGGLLASLTRHSINYAAVDYPGLHHTVVYHQGNPSRNNDTAALTSLKMLMIDTLVPDPKADMDVITFLLRPFGCPSPQDALAPVCSLQAYGGMIVSIGEPSFTAEPRSIWLDREAFRQERVERVNDPQLTSGQVDSQAIEVVSFGCLLPEVTVIIVNPSDNTVCSPDMIGEVWVDSPSLSGGYWNLPSLTEQEFHARAFFPDNFQPLEGEFLRTGLAGSLIDQQLVIFGWLDQRIRTRALAQTEDGPSLLSNHGTDIVRTIRASIKGIDDCTAFEVTSRGLPVGIVVVESRMETEAEFMAQVGQIRTLCSDVHCFTPFYVILSSPGSLPRRLRNGAELVSFFRTRTALLEGNLPLLHIAIDAHGYQDDPATHYEDSVSPHFLVPQHTGMEIMPPAVDERFGSDLEGFKSITQLLLWRSTAGGDDPAFVSVDAKGKEAKVVSFYKATTKALSLAYHLVTKRGLVKQNAVLIFMPPGLDYVIAVHACLAADLVVIPYWDFDAARLHEEIPALVRLVEDFSVVAILVNPATEDRLRAKSAQALFKNYPQFTLPTIINISKAPKITRRLDGVFSGLAGVLVLVYFSPDMKRQCISFSPPALLHQCKLHKYELGLTPSRPLLTCARVYNGIGFFHSALLGIYVGCQTILLSQAEFASSPRVWFELLSTKGCSATYATTPMLRHASSTLSQTGLQALPRLKCLLIPTEGRPEDEANSLFSGLGIDMTILATAYTTPFHSLVSHRAFIGQDPLVLNLHLPSLRLGRIRVQGEDAPGLLLGDSGRISRDTMVAIVNPVTGTVCQLNEVGEIWVASDGNADGLCFPESDFEAARFGAQIEGGDPSLYYVRTGDLGFLYPDTYHDSRPVPEIIATSPYSTSLAPWTRRLMPMGSLTTPTMLKSRLSLVTL
ncbi:hypothetical protein DSO57_1018213 [Entomophthora muscae]|uniref:Uncharacterized protein n=1 Tax=Entomophthora muscae TaxID=34485 RepID=A0ACC2RVN5_9FUNG|nr:hypothetical protein DSO57_1018213 [Entomophthora muscae]